ncbi:MAG TPA: VanZ family protein [Thermoanaerobaculia bacterium]|nr:VanZ family protein [Thermoanaerobaculia bacterium]
MGKRQVRVVRVPKRVTLLLLLIVSIAMVALLWFLSGKAYAGEAHPIRDLFVRLFGGGQSPSRDALLAIFMPVIANVLLFVPWGFLLFIVIDTVSRPRARTYGLTIGAGILFSIIMIVWQEFLPTRVTAFGDVLSNAIGALAGAALGHLRREVHVRFDF